MRIIIELQNESMTPARAYTDNNAGEAAYHTTVAAAAVSDVHEHSVAMLDETLQVVAKQTYYH